MARVCVGRGQQLVVWLLGFLGASSPGTAALEGCGCFWAGKWARGEAITCLGMAVPLPLPKYRRPVLLFHTLCQQGPPSKDASYPALSGCWTGQVLWARREGG